MVKKIIKFYAQIFSDIYVFLLFEKKKKTMKESIDLLTGCLD